MMSVARRPQLELSEQLSLLSARLPQLVDISEHLFASFDARHFRTPKVIWLNKRWLLQQGITILDEQCRVDLENWLLDTYAVSVPSGDEPADTFVGDRVTMYADRYGLTGGMLNGGSGRVGTIGCFNAKGIGRTPLVSNSADWYHAHGYLWLEEAIREAITSEIVAAEFPLGAVPVVAILDPGEPIYWRDGSTGDHRAILVRPNFVRLGHFQRSIFFGSAGTPSSDQYIDGRRVEDFFNFFFRQNLDGGSYSRIEIATVFEAIGMQYGFSNAAKLWLGPFLDNNFAVDGRIVDFGTFRALTSRSVSRDAFGPRHVPHDDQLVLDCAKSFSRSFAKYRLGAVQAQELYRRYRRGLDFGFKRFFQEGRSRRTEPLTPRQKSKEGSGASPVLGDRNETVDTTDVEEVGFQTSTLLGSPKLKRLLLPRPELDREQLLKSTKAFLKEHYNGSEFFAAKLNAFIDGVIGRSMRHWAGLADDFELAGQSHSGHNSWLIAAGNCDGQPKCLLRGVVSYEHFYAANIALPVQDISAHLRVIGANVADLVVELESGYGILPTGDRLAIPAEPFCYSVST